MYTSSPSCAWTRVISSYLYMYTYIYTHTWICLSSSSCAWTVVISSNMACSSPSSCSVWLIHVSAKTHDAFIYAPSFVTHPHECHDSRVYDQVLLAEFLFCMTHLRKCHDSWPMTHLRKCHDSWPIHTRATIHDVFTQISWLMVHHYVSHGTHMCLPRWVMRYPWCVRYMRTHVYAMTYRSRIGVCSTYVYTWLMTHGSFMCVYMYTHI